MAPSHLFKTLSLVLYTCTYMYLNISMRHQKWYWSKYAVTKLRIYCQLKNINVQNTIALYGLLQCHLKMSVWFWLVGCFGFNGPLRQYFSLYRAVSQREGERRERIDESKNVQTTPTRTYCKRNRPLPYCNQNCRTPRHWKITQHHRTTRPPPMSVWNR